MKQVRRLLEKELKVEQGVLDSMKDFISAEVGKVRVCGLGGPPQAAGRPSTSAGHAWQAIELQVMTCYFCCLCS